MTVPSEPASSDRRATRQRLGRGARQTRHLALSILLEETGTSPLARGAILMIGLAVSCFIGWAAVTSVPEISMAQGRVVPVGNVKRVQHLEGGIVAAVLVREGDVVAEGQPLLRLDQTLPGAEYAEASARQADLVLQSERLQAFLAGGEGDWHWGQDWPQLAVHQQASLRAQRGQLTSALAVIEAQVDEHRAEIAQATQQIAAVDRQLSIVGEVVAIREQLLRDGLQSRIVYLDNQRDLVRLQGERVRLSSDIRRSEQAILEAESRAAELHSKISSQATAELAQVTAELVQLQQRLALLRDRLDRVVVEAPIAGVVQGLVVSNVGAVLPPGAIVAEIVPEDAPVEVEAEVAPRDIGHLAPGQPVRIKVSSFDFARFGAANGRVEAISPTSFQDERRGDYFKARISLSSPFIGPEAAVRRVLPGMLVQTDIVTGEKTLLHYLLKPIAVALDTAFRER
jgi:HlyD family secretion protein/adhesin transport system membrane fusion protein